MTCWLEAQGSVRIASEKVQISVEPQIFTCYIHFYNQYIITLSYWYNAFIDIALLASANLPDMITASSESKPYTCIHIPLVNDTCTPKHAITHK